MKRISRMGIRKQVLFLVLSCSIITLLIAGGISLFGMINIKANAVNVGVEIGEAAAEKSAEALKETVMKSLEGIVYERSKQVNHLFRSVQWDVKALSDEMTKILTNYWDYAPRYVAEPDWNNEGIIVAQLQYRADVNRAALAEEVGLTANLQDWLYQMNASEDMITSNYVASVNGFNITVDAASERRVDEYNNPLPNDYSVRPWYQKAMQEQKVTFTDVFNDSHGRGLAVSCVSPYYDAYGSIAGVVGEGMLLESVDDIVLSTKIGETGYGFIMNNKGRILFSPKNTGDLAIDSEEDPSLLDDAKDPTLAAAAKLMATGKSGLEYVMINGIPCYVAFAPLESTNWSFGIVIEESEITTSAEISRQIIEQNTGDFVAMLNDSIKMLILAIFGAFVVIMLIVPFFGRKIADSFTKPINILTDGVREIASGNLDKKLDIHTGNEIEHLATCFNAMTDELKMQMANLTKVTAEREKIATELNVATNIQLSMLPRDFDFGREDFEIYATMNAAKAVGGDFYDFYLLDENHLVVTIADVSGKGVPAALFMSRSKTILKNFTMTMQNPDDFEAVMTLANNQLCQDNDEMMFVTVFMGMLDLQTGKFVYVNGGHNPPVIYNSAKKSYSYLEVEQNCVLGLMDEMDFVQQEIQMQAGDMIYMYTDGVTEAMDIQNNQYGEARLLKCLNQINPACNLQKLLADVRADLAEHVGAAEQSDDITMLAVRLNR